MEKYVIYYNETTTSKQYVENIYRSNVSHDTDMGDAIEFDNKEVAITVKDYLNRRQSGKNYKVMCIKTSLDEEVE